MVELYYSATVHCTTSFPPLWKKYISLWYAGPLNRHQLYIVIVAKPYAWLQEPADSDRPFSAVSWSLSNIVRFPPVRHCQIPSTSLQRQRCTRVLEATTGGVVEGRGRSVRLQFGSPGQPRRFSIATKKVLACSHSRSLQLLCTVGGGQARLDARTEFEIFAALAKWGGRKLVVQCTVAH
jgi:hypothetical protein